MSTHPVLLITGTDTGVGKTFVAAGLARALIEAGIRVRAVKPVETGCGESPSPLEDGRILAEATGQPCPRAALQRLRAALAPPDAADLEGVRLSMEPWCEQILALSRDAELTLVEGAGGLLSPLTWTETALDLARRCQARVLIVAANRLGALNHTLLTLGVLAQAGLETVGVVFNQPALPDGATPRNPAALRKFTGLSRVMTLERFESAGEAVAALREVIPWIDR